jgi:hypothetical protein
MLGTFRRRNFPNAGLCQILRALVFEAHLKLLGYCSFAALDRAYTHTLTARCNGYGLNALRSALDYGARTPAERIEIDRGYLAEITAHELAEERKLTAQVLAFFCVGSPAQRPRFGIPRKLRELLDRRPL